MVDMIDNETQDSSNNASCNDVRRMMPEYVLWSA